MWAVNRDSRPIGMFDSGVGGLSVLREVRAALPGESVVYLADQRFAPYGERSLDEVKERAVQIAGQLLEAGVKTVVVACNSASAAALYSLREQYPETPFIGLEPAVKPAALSSESGVIGVLATKATFQGELFASVVDRHAGDVEVLTCVGNGLVDMVERGDDSSAVGELLDRYLTPLVEQGMDTLVLGCTHYTFLVDEIRDVVGPDITVVDPAPAVARQVARVVDGTAAKSGPRGAVTYATTGDPQRFESMIGRLLGEAPTTSPSRW